LQNAPSTRCVAPSPAEMAERNAGVAEARRIKFHMGINLGDIIKDGRDIYGDGVNVAARLEALAEPAGPGFRQEAGEAAPIPAG
jgi:adenylate cyclase